MKLLLAPVVIGVAMLMSILMLFSNGGNAAAPYACGQLGIILDTIRTQESGGDYTARADRNGHRPNAGSASGAYQYVNSTWQYWAEQAAIDTTTYPTADSAPPEIQDRVAGANVASILQDHDGLVEAVPVIWYYPVAWDNPTIMDSIPAPQFGNRLTVREYQTKWMELYLNKLIEAGGTPDPVAPAGFNPDQDEPTTDPNPDPNTDQDEPTAPAPEADLGLQPCAGITDATGQWALPAPRDTMNHDKIRAPHGYPAWDLIIPNGTPIYAVTGGVVANVQTWPENWWRYGCGANERPECRSCGIGVTIQHDGGLRHTYCHGLASHVAVGDQIVPGQLVLTSGDSGRSGTPHLHLEFRINNVRYCPQTLILALYEGLPVPDPATLPTSGC